jgi:acyl-coenzyme A synthetase/AMP-(fatty) acid ligase
MIKVAGEIVFEPEVESAIHKHPGVGEVAVIGVPDKLRGEVPCAFVQKNRVGISDLLSLRERGPGHWCRLGPR